KIKSFDKVTFSITGHFSRNFSKPQYKVKIRNKEGLYGRKQLKLRSDGIDPTTLRSKLVADIHNRLGTPSVSANFITLYINDEYMGLYILTDAYKLSWVEEEYGEKDTTSLYQMSHCKLTLSHTCEVENENEDHPDSSEIKSFIKKLDEAESVEDVEDILDVDQFLTEMAIDYLTGGWDHIQASHNYYMFKPKGGKWLYLSYDSDLDLAGHEMYPLYRFEDYTNDIHILDVLIVRNSTRFDNIVQDIMHKVFNPATLFPRIDELKELIREYVIRDYVEDENGFYPGRINHSCWDLFSYQKWEANCDFTTIDNPQWHYTFGIKYWILARYRFLCTYYNMECDPVYMDENYEYSVDKSVEYPRELMRSPFAIEYEKNYLYRKPDAEYIDDYNNYNGDYNRYGTMYGTEFSVTTTDIFDYPHSNPIFFEIPTTSLESFGYRHHHYYDDEEVTSYIDFISNTTDFDIFDDGKEKEEEEDVYEEPSPSKSLYFMGKITITKTVSLPTSVVSTFTEITSSNEPMDNPTMTEFETETVAVN
ncbi:hypothetical protein PIROE2DRAFT_10129, partial [Piromyces sp. E2]